MAGEDFGESFERPKSVKNPSVLIWAIFLFGIFLVSVGAGFYFFKNSSSSSGISVISASESAKTVSEIVVDVGGEVVKPGVYKVSVESRINDAVVAAGGLSDSADSSRVNLAAKIVDGQKVYIPKIGEASSFAEVGTSLGASTRLINVNTASSGDLEKLPGIGPVTAQK